MSGDGLSRHRAGAQRRGVLLAEHRLRPVRRQGDDGPRAALRRRGAVRPAPDPAGRHRRIGHRRPRSTSATDGVTAWFNQSGNAWSAPTPIAVFPSADQLSTVQVIDLLGTGTACLVWSSPLPGETAAPLRLRGPDGRPQAAPDDRRAQQPRGGDPGQLRAVDPLLPRRRGGGQAVGHPAAVPGAGRRAGRDDRLDRPEPAGHPLRLSSRLLRRLRARVPRLRHGRAAGHRGVPRRHRASTTATSSTGTSESWSPPVLTRTWFHTGAFTDALAVSAAVPERVLDRARPAGAGPGRRRRGDAAARHRAAGRPQRRSRSRRPTAR